MNAASFGCNSSTRGLGAKSMLTSMTSMTLPVTSGLRTGERYPARVGATDRPLDEADVDPDPLVQFRIWFDDAVAHDAEQPEAMVVATVAPDGAPNARVVLLRGIDDDGFRFFTNFESTKGVELAGDPRVAIVFHWRET